MNNSMAEIEENIRSRNVSDRIMWFSMWFLLTIVTFGAVGPFMMYHLIKRRNDHLKRLTRLQELVLDRLRRVPNESFANTLTGEYSPEARDTALLRNASAWALSCLLIFPAIYSLYFLTKDLQAHYKSECSFFTEIASLVPSFNFNLPSDEFGSGKKPWRKYLMLTVITLGLASVYWLYRLFNDYNYHFKTQWKIENNLLLCLKNLSS